MEISNKYYIVAVALSPEDTVLSEHGECMTFSNYSDACMEYVDTHPLGTEEVRLIEINSEDEEDWYVVDRKQKVP